MKGIEATNIVATGYGRKLFTDNGNSNNVSAITEMQAYALGAGRVWPDARMVLDIGARIPR